VGGGGEGRVGSHARARGMYVYKLYSFTETSLNVLKSLKKNAQHTACPLLLIIINKITKNKSGFS
jgi:hypothetical protein